MTGDLAGLRAAMLDAWGASPTRCREDAEAEADLRGVGYRDRLFTELAQNAADAAAGAGPGAVGVWLDGLHPDDSGEGATDGEPADETGAARLHVANTGAPLDAAGVAALCALRASDKTAGVGRFGVGFTAVTTVSDRIEIRSRSMSVLFSADLTRRAVRERGIRIPDVGPPVLRLPWECPGAGGPADGWDTEVVLTLRPGIDPAELLDRAAMEAPELLLELPALAGIVVGGRRWCRTDTPADSPLGADDGSAGAARGDAGRKGADLARIVIGEYNDDGERESVTREYLARDSGDARWIVPVGADGAVHAVDGGVLHAPTPSDEQLSLPAILVAHVPTTPDRRRVMPATPLAHLAEPYPGLLAALPRDERVGLVPRAGFPRSAVDEALHEAVRDELRRRPWVPAADGAAIPGARARVLPGMTVDLAAVLGDTIDGLVAAEASGPASVAALTSVGAAELSLAGLVDLLGGIDRDPPWWGRLYDALEAVVDASGGQWREALGALPVPLADGRLVTGPRTTVIGIGTGPAGDAAGAGEVTWARLVHPAAARGLLTRLGAQEATPRELLQAPELADLVARTDELVFTPVDEASSAADAIGAPDPIGLADAVLALAGGAWPHGPDRDAPEWFGSLLLADTAGELRPADELLIPGSPLAEVLAEPSPLGTVADGIVARYPPAGDGAGPLRAVGAGWGFAVVRAELPTGPDHDLDAEEAWWAGLPEEPAEMRAVRDLDLVAHDAWPRALDLLLADPQTRPLLADRDGYTAWWLRAHVRVGGRALCAYTGDGSAFEGLLDPFEHPEAHALGGVLAQDRVDSPALAQALLGALADPDRCVGPAAAARAHRALVDGACGGGFDAAALPQPAGVRALDGTVVGLTGPGRNDDVDVDADVDETGEDEGDESRRAAVVVDEPWKAALLRDEAIVPAAGLEADGAAMLADMLGCPLASGEVHARVVSRGRDSTWDAEPGAVRAAAMQGADLPAGRLVVHEPLLVQRTDAGGRADSERRVGWWIDDPAGSGGCPTVHVDGGGGGGPCGGAWTAPLGRISVWLRCAAGRG